jgi:hypothetical protein
MRRWIAGVDKLPRSLSSPADGVGHIRTAVARDIPVFERPTFAKSGPAAVAFGVGQSATIIPRSTFFPRANSRIAPFAVLVDFDPSLDLGVGNEPDPVTSVRGANGCCWDTIPDRIIPARGQVSENVSQPETKQAWYVLHDDIEGSNFANEAGILAPEARALTLKASALSSEADVLTREPATYDVDCNSVSGQSVSVEGADVFIAGNLGPVFLENATRVFFDLAERHGFKSARAFQAEGEAPDAAEKIEHAQLAHPASSTRIRSSLSRNASASQ